MMEASTPTTKTLEQCRIEPAPGCAAQFSLPLTFFDMPWLPFHILRRLLFYGFPCSKTHFLDTILPDLKHSLFLTLKHFLPLVGNLIYPLDDDDACKPEFRYATGDSVSLTVVECATDFDYLIGNHARNADEFYPLLPQLVPWPGTNFPGCKTIPLLALQVTLFPGKGICIGIVNRHVVGDASSIFGFIRAWASIHRLGGDSHLLAGNFQPCYDRLVVKYPSELDAIYWNEIRKIGVGDFQSLNLPTNKVRAKFVIRQDQIKMLKNLAVTQRPSLAHVSAFTVTCAYVWTCLVKSSDSVGEARDDCDDTEFLICAVDCRARLDPPAPATYFGNCLAPCIVRSTRTELIGHEGFLIAVELIGEAIGALVHSDKGILADAETWLSKLGQVFGKSSVGVAGSTKFDVYDTDYGWGKPMAFETVSIDDDGGIALSKCRESYGGLEIGLSLPKTKMDAFTVTFADGLK